MEWKHLHQNTNDGGWCRYLVWHYDIRYSQRHTLEASGWEVIVWISSHRRVWCAEDYKTLRPRIHDLLLRLKNPLRNQRFFKHNLPHQFLNWCWEPSSNPTNTQTVKGCSRNRCIHWHQTNPTPLKWKITLSRFSGYSFSVARYVLHPLITLIKNLLGRSLSFLVQASSLLRVYPKNH